MLVGITTVSAISSAIEGALKSLSDIIIQNKDQAQGKSVWSFFNVFTWDDVTKDVKGCTFVYHDLIIFSHQDVSCR